MTNAGIQPECGFRQHPVKPEMAAGDKQAIMKEIGTKWDKFSEPELSAIKGKDDLIAQLSAKYHMDRVVAQRDVDALLKGRHI